MCIEIRGRGKGIHGKVNNGKGSADPGGVVMFSMEMWRRSNSVLIACSNSDMVYGS